jgi:hypothetical protein
VRSNTKETWRDVSVFALLVAIGVAGRWAQPEWCFTPLAATSIFAGFYFARPIVAALVPLAIMSISDLILPAYDNLPVMVVTYAVMTLPIWAGRLLRQESTTGRKAILWGLCGFVPATIFFVATNFAVWAFQSDYAKNASGLMECYWAAVPFYRWMLAGDIFYLAILMGCFALASAWQSEAKTAAA